MKKLFVAALVLGLAVSASADTVQIDNWDGPFVNYGLGPLDDGIEPGMSWVNIGYGPPASFVTATGTAVPPNEGSDAQGFRVPGTAYDENPIGSCAVLNLNEAQDAAVEIDYEAFVQAKGGGAPDLSEPAYFTMDLMIQADDLTDYNLLKITFDHWFDDNTGKTVTPFVAVEAGVVQPGFVNGAWYDDVVLETYDPFPTDPICPGVFADFDIANPDAGNVTFYWDDLKIHYVPEPCSLFALGAGLIGLIGIRRRRS